MTNLKMSQDEMIKRHLQSVGTITCAEAQTVYRCRSLTSVIARLRKDGLKIDSQRKKDPMGQRYVRYNYSK